MPGVPATNARFEPIPRITARRQIDPYTRSSRSVAGGGLAIRRVLNPQLPIRPPMLTAILAATSHTIALTPTGSRGARIKGRIPAKHHKSAKNAEGLSHVPASVRIAAAQAIKAIDAISAADVALLMSCGARSEQD